MALRYWPDRAGQPLASPCRAYALGLLDTSDSNCCCVEASSSSSSNPFENCPCSTSGLAETYTATAYYNMSNYMDTVTLTFDGTGGVCSWHGQGYSSFHGDYFDLYLEWDANGLADQWSIRIEPAFDTFSWSGTSPTADDPCNPLADGTDFSPMTSAVYTFKVVLSA